MSSSTLSFPFALIGVLAFSACTKKNKGGYGTEDGELAGLFALTPGFKFDYQVEAMTPIDANRIVVDITQPDVLKQFEDNGYDFSQLIALAEFNSPVKRNDNADHFAKSSWYNSMVKYLKGEIDAIGTPGTPHKLKEKNGTTSGKHQYSYGTADFSNIRIFQSKLMESKFAKFDLTAIVNRTDRMDFATDASGAFTNCGEVRFVYRMSYHIPKGSPDAGNKGGKGTINTEVYSRLPFTTNIVFEAKPAAGNAANHLACRDVARRWLTPSKITTGLELRSWISKSAINLSQLKFKQIETNIQAARIPSELRVRLGGQAEYLLRVFRPEGKVLKPVLLENTPNVNAIASNPVLKAELADWIASNIEAIENGTHKLPEKFLTVEAKSFTTFGVHRMANKPFTAIFNPDLQANTALKAKLRNATNGPRKFLKSPESVLLRLDDATCMGCHQGNSVAGFHIVGIDRTDTTHPFNALKVAFSSHYMKETVRRNSYYRRLAIDGNFDAKLGNTFRPLSFQHWAMEGPPATAKLGERCFDTTQWSAHFSGNVAWTCQAGLTCKNMVQSKMLPDIGMCMRDRGFGGDACLTARMDVLQFNFPRLDDFDSLTKMPACRTGRCLLPEGGVPGGLCITRRAEDSGNFDPKERTFGVDKHGAELVTYNGGAAFDVCAGSDNWADCINKADSTSEGIRQFCNETIPCRDDYICQTYFKVDGAAKRIFSPFDHKGPGHTKGYCVPTYFIFQMRVDGHPILK
jgi:hypothetical protein